MGLSGIIDDMMEKAYFEADGRDHSSTPKVIAQIERTGKIPFALPKQKRKTAPVLGVTGTGGAGKSSLIDELLLRLQLFYPEKKAALISVDPSKHDRKGALLGDRIRLTCRPGEGLFVRSQATRGSGTELSPHMEEVVRYLKSLDVDLIIVETSGIGQSGRAVKDIADKCLFVMTPEYGAATQLERLKCWNRPILRPSTSLKNQGAKMPSGTFESSTGGTRTSFLRPMKTSRSLGQSRPDSMMKG